MLFTFGIVAAVLVAGWIAVVALLYSRQDRVLFQPPGPVAGTPTARRLEYSAADNAPLFAYVVGDPRHATDVVLAFHGNADLARWYLPWAEELSRRTGAVVVVPEFRGYDGLPGQPSYATGALDAEAALEATTALTGRQAGEMVMFGHSLGSAIVTELATRHPPRVLILQSPFTSARAMAQRMRIPGLLLFWERGSRIHYHTAERVRSLGVPVWVAHGARDIVVPIAMGRAVHGAAAVQGEWLEIADAGHNDVDETGGDRYWAWFERAMRDSRTAPRD